VEPAAEELADNDIEGRTLQRTVLSASPDEACVGGRRPVAEDATNEVSVSEGVRLLREFAASAKELRALGVREVFDKAGIDNSRLFGRCEEDSRGRDRMYDVVLVKIADGLCESEEELHLRKRGFGIGVPDESVMLADDEPSPVRHLAKSVGEDDERMLEGHEAAEVA
jgi:hypothetical protein